MGAALEQVRKAQERVEAAVSVNARLSAQPTSLAIAKAHAQALALSHRKPNIIYNFDAMAASQAAQATGQARKQRTFSAISTRITGQAFSGAGGSGSGSSNTQEDEEIDYEDDDESDEERPAGKVPTGAVATGAATEPNFEKSHTVDQSHREAYGRGYYAKQ